MLLKRTREDLEQCWMENVGDADNATLIARVDCLFQVRFPYCLVDAV